MLNDPTGHNEEAFSLYFSLFCCLGCAPRWPGCLWGMMYKAHSQSLLRILKGGGACGATTRSGSRASAWSASPPPPPAHRSDAIPGDGMSRRGRCGAVVGPNPWGGVRFRPFRASRGKMLIPGCLEGQVGDETTEGRDTGGERQRSPRCYIIPHGSGIALDVFAGG